jgi:hypothetical protein
MLGWDMVRVAGANQYDFGASAHIWDWGTININGKDKDRNNK